MPERTDVASRADDPPQTREEFEERLRSLLIVAYRNDVRIAGGADISTKGAAWGVEITELETAADD